MTKCTVLIVDDDEIFRMMLRTILEDEHNILETGDGTEVLTLAREHKPDLILLDVRMPGSNGFEICGDLKSDSETGDIPVIFVTSLSKPGDEAKGLECGAIDYIRKPLNSAIVRARVRNHLELKKYSDMLADLSALDGLTGIANRRQFDEHLDREWRRAARSGKTLSLIMMDIDFFKPFNDTYGHLAGDNCLKRVAQLLAGLTHRPGDLLARYGGEEFAALLPDTATDGATSMAKAFRAGIEALAIPHAASEAAEGVTISAGLASLEPQAGGEPAGLIEAADRMLYAAKKAGRNRVHSTDALPQGGEMN